METTYLKETILALAKEAENRSETSRMREVLDEIEVAIAAGVHRKKIFEALKKHGFQMSEKTFENTLYRLRKEKKHKGSQPKIKEIHQETENNLTEKNTIQKTYNHRKIDKIFSNQSDLNNLEKFAKSKNTEKKSSDESSKEEQINLIYQEELTEKQRREKIADLFVGETKISPRLQRILEKKNESSSD